MLTRRYFTQILATGLLVGGRSLRGETINSPALELATHEDFSNAEHWRLTTDGTWQWYERQSLINGAWKITGITTPVDIATGERFTGETGYLEDNLVPDQVRFGGQITAEVLAGKEPIYIGAGQPDADRRAHDGRPPSPWLRSLSADELRVWLSTVEIPQADVSGMTFWTHLTRDHGFDGRMIEGLGEDDLAKLHAAAHFGY